MQIGQIRPAIAPSSAAATIPSPASRTSRWEAAVTLGNITFGTVNGGSYDIVGTSANTLGMTGSTPTVTVNSNVTAEIDAAIAVTGSQPDLTVNGAGTLDMSPTVEGSNYHGLILGGTSNVVLLTAAAVPIAVPNNNTAANFAGGTLTFAATPTTDISGRFTNTGSNATNIGVTNGAVVTFASPLVGSGGLNVTGSGTGSTLKLTEGSGSQVGFSGSGGVNVNGATLFLTGNNNNELGSNAVTVGINGVLSSNSTKLVTTGTTTVNGTSPVEAAMSPAIPTETCTFPLRHSAPPERMTGN